MRNMGTLLRAALMLWVFVANAHPPVVQQQVVRVGIQEIDYYPHFDFSSQPPRGYFYELMRLFAQRSKLKIEFVPLPVRRLYQEAADGVDVVYPDNPRWQRYLVVNLSKYYSAPVEMNLGTTLVLPENRDMPLGKVRSVAIIHGFTPTKWLEMASQYRYRLVEVADVDSALGLVLKGRVDAANVEYHVAQHYMQQHKLQGKLVVGSQLPYTQLAFLLSSFRDEALIQQFNQFLQQNAADVDALRQKYQLFQQLPEPHQPE
jgi:ABC-type amino acid transport substrate-binding protein